MEVKTTYCIKTNQMNGGDNNGTDRRGKIKTDGTAR